MKSPILPSRLILIDEHKMIINGIKLLIGDQVDQFHEAQTKDAALSLINDFKHDLVIIDYALQQITGDIIVKEIKYRFPQTRILAYSLNSDIETIMSMFYAGVNGYILKSGDEEELLNAIQAIMTGKEYFCMEARNHLINRIYNDCSSTDIKYSIANRRFNHTEIEIIRLICKEMTAREISKELYLSERTVEQYRNNISKRIGSRNIAGIIKFALKNGVVRLQDI